MKLHNGAILILGAAITGAGTATINDQIGFIPVFVGVAVIICGLFADFDKS